MMRSYDSPFVSYFPPANQLSNARGEFRFARRGQNVNSTSLFAYYFVFFAMKAESSPR